VANYRIHPMMISGLVLLVVFTLVFTFLVIHESSQITEMLEGGTGEGMAGKATLTKLKSDEADELRKVSMALEAIALRKREIFRDDLTLQQYRYYMNGTKVLSGVSTPDNKTLDGKPLNDSDWVVARDSIATSVKTMESLRAGARERRAPEIHPAREPRSRTARMSSRRCSSASMTRKPSSRKTASGSASSSSC
jgi:hypothetical protein